MNLPPLRDRPEDIGPLVQHFIASMAQALNVPPLEPTQRVLAGMAAYDWPGNVRELRNFIERSLILGWFDLGLDENDVAADNGSLASSESLESVEKRHILAMLGACQGNKSEAARRLGISRKTLDRKCTAWGCE